MNSLYKALFEIDQQGISAALCTIIESKGSTPRHETSKMLVYSGGNIVGSVGGGEIENRVIKEALQVISEGKARLVYYKLDDPKAGDPGICGGQVSVFIEPLGHKDKLVIIGAGHVGKAVAHLGRWLGFRIVVSDDRAEFCNADLIPDADEFIVCQMKDLPKQIDISKSTYLVLTTRGSDVDAVGLPKLLKTEPAYLGIIGSKRRWLQTQKVLREVGIDEVVLKSIHSPIGLELEAESPEEIAVSILAEVIMLRNRGTGKTMRL